MRSIRFFGKCFQQIKSIRNFCAKRKKETNERKKGNKGHGGYQQGIWHSLPLDKYQVCIVFTFTGCALYLTIKHVLSRAIRSFRGTIDSRSVQLSLCYRSVFRILSAATREINSLPREKYQKWRGDTIKKECSTLLALHQGYPDRSQCPFYPFNSIYSKEKRFSRRVKG